VRNLVGLFICIAGAAASATTFELDPSKTEINFTLHDPLHTVHGTFTLRRGRMQLDPDTGEASGEMVIDVPSGISGNGSRDKRMHKEILESQKYPEAVFTPGQVRGQIEPEGTSEIDVHGNFRIHGADHEIIVHFQVQANGSQFIATGSFTIPYVKWGMKNPSNFLLKVDNTVEIDARSEAAEKR
jgi:polyisoprenoid-binding protein YceI